MNYFVKVFINDREIAYKFQDENQAFRFAGDAIQSTDCIKCIIGYDEIFGEEVVLTTIIGRNEIKFSSI